VRVVTASGDKTARVWDAATGAPIGKPLQHEGSVNSASFSPDGARVVTASTDKTARVWTGPPLAPNIVATACKMLGDHDTANLSTRYGIDVKDRFVPGKNRHPTPHTGSTAEPCQHPRSLQAGRLNAIRLAAEVGA
jgi:hypothetical protein